MVIASCSGQCGQAMLEKTVLDAGCWRLGSLRLIVEAAPTAAWVDVAVPSWSSICVWALFLVDVDMGSMQAKEHTEA